MRYRLEEEQREKKSKEEGEKLEGGWWGMGRHTDRREERDDKSRGTTQGRMKKQETSKQHQITNREILEK